MNDAAPVQKRCLQGLVVSTKMDKTIVVRVGRVKVHPLYHKRFTETKKYKAHDEKNEAHEGDHVIIEESRPRSKDKRWTLKEILSQKK